jgi:hypothetical protein
VQKVIDRCVGWSIDNTNNKLPLLGLHRAAQCLKNGCALSYLYYCAIKEMLENDGKTAPFLLFDCRGLLT